MIADSRPWPHHGACLEVARWLQAYRMPGKDPRLINGHIPNQESALKVRPGDVSSPGIELGEAILRQARIAAALHLALSARKVQQENEV